MLSERFHDEEIDLHDTDDGDEQPKKRRKPQVGPAILDECLEPLTGEPKQLRIAVVDIETVTDRETQDVDPYAIGFYDGRTPVLWEKRGREITCYGVAKAPHPGGELEDEFFRYFLRKKYIGTVCFAHNGGRFDFAGLFGRFALGTPLHKAGFRAELIPIAGCILRVVITHEKVKGRWVMSDSYRLINSPLDKLGQTFGVGRKVDLRSELGLRAEVDEDTLYAELAKPRNRQTMLKYLRQDCIVLFDALEKFQDMLNRKGIQMRATAPGCAMDGWRRNYLPRNTVFRNRHLNSCPDVAKKEGQRPSCGTNGQEPCGHAFFRLAYFGGRVEIFTHKGPLARGERIQYFDYNSHYPAVMLERMPVGRAVEYTEGKPEDVWRRIKAGLIGIVECEVVIPDDCPVPPLPCKEKRNAAGELDERATEKLIFRNGRIRGTWDTAELELLNECGGRIESVGKNVWFTSAPIFREFVTDFYKLRDKAAPGYDPGMSELSKLMQNSLYGKFGQRGEATAIIFNPTLEDFSKGLIPYAEKFGAYLLETDVDHEHVAPQIAVHVTALARAKLWRELMKVVRAGGRLYYCDTDSIIASGVDDWKSSKALGELKAEHTHIIRVELVLPKLYAFQCAPDCCCAVDARASAKAWKEWKHRNKGFGSGFGKRFTMDSFRVLTDPALSVEQRVFFSRRVTQVKTILKKTAPGQRLKMRMTEEKRAIRSAYTKRLLSKDGVTTRPIVG